MQLLDIENDFYMPFISVPIVQSVKQSFLSKYKESSIFMAVGSNPGKTSFFSFLSIFIQRCIKLS